MLAVFWEQVLFEWRIKQGFEEALAHEVGLKEEEIGLLPTLQVEDGAGGDHLIHSVGGLGAGRQGCEGWWGVRGLGPLALIWNS